MWGTSHGIQSFTTAPVWVFPIGCSSSRNVWARVYFIQSGAALQEQTDPAWVPHGTQLLPENLLQCGPLWTSHSSARSLLPHGLSMSCSFLHGIFNCSGESLLQRHCFSYFFSLHSPLTELLGRGFYPCLSVLSLMHWLVITATGLADASALSCSSSTGVSWNCLCAIREQSLACSHRGNLCSPPAAKTLSYKSSTVAYLLR